MFATKILTLLVTVNLRISTFRSLKNALVSWSLNNIMFKGFLTYALCFKSETDLWVSSCSKVQLGGESAFVWFLAYISFLFRLRQHLKVTITDLSASSYILCYSEEPLTYLLSLLIKVSMIYLRNWYRKLLLRRLSISLNFKQSQLGKYRSYEKNTRNLFGRQFY